MKRAAQWRASKFERVGERWRGSRDAREPGVGSRRIRDLVVARDQTELRTHARGRLLDLDCDKAPLDGCHAPFVSEVTCVDWPDGDSIDRIGDLDEPLRFEADRFDTIIPPDVLEDLPEPAALWREIARVLAPARTILMNVPFYASIHAHPHDDHRCTNFAVERFARINGLARVRLSAVGGLLEVLADLLAKAGSKVPWVGCPFAGAVQAVALAFARSGTGQRVLQTSSRHLPLGYFLIAQRPAQLALR